GVGVAQLDQVHDHRVALAEAFADDPGLAVVAGAERGDLGQGTSVLEDPGTAGGRRLGTQPLLEAAFLGRGIDGQRAPGGSAQRRRARAGAEPARGGRGVDPGGPARRLVRVLAIVVLRVLLAARGVGRLVGLVGGLGVVGLVAEALVTEPLAAEALRTVAVAAEPLGAETLAPVTVFAVAVAVARPLGVRTGSARATAFARARGAIVDVVVFVILERNHAEVRLELVQRAHLVDLPSAPVAAGC